MDSNNNAFSINDSPFTAKLPHHNDAADFLSELSVNDYFQTHVAITGTYMNGWIPISISTAYWNMRGVARYVNVATNPPTSDADVYNLGKWSVTGISPTGPNTYPGDNIIKFIKYNGNASLALEDYLNRSKVLQTHRIEISNNLTDEGKRHVRGITDRATNHTLVYILDFSLPAPLFGSESPTSSIVRNRFKLARLSVLAQRSVLIDPVRANVKLPFQIEE